MNAVRQIPGVHYVTGIVENKAILVRDQNQAVVFVKGVDSNYIHINNYGIVQGKKFHFYDKKTYNAFIEYYKKEIIDIINVVHGLILQFGYYLY